jgi:hypothetical protein
MQLLQLFTRRWRAVLCCAVLWCAGSGLVAMGDAHVLVRLNMHAIGALQVCAAAAAAAARDG